MNPGVDQRIVNEAYENDPESAKAEYGGEFRTDLADFVSARDGRCGDHVGPLRAAA